MVVDRERSASPDEARHGSIHQRIVKAPNRASPYNTKRWRVERLDHLRSEPFCRFCAEQGRKIPATVVDHIQPWRGNLTLFWDRTNWQSLCKSCHDGAKQRLERSGHLVGSDASGMPLDPAHHWNA
jgi:5-methylcytosine-specific restriction endonuclease McrA